jgi:hypothetical protein
MNRIQTQFSSSPRRGQGMTNPERMVSHSFTSDRERGLKRSPCRGFLTATFVSASLALQIAGASIVTWDVDPTNSYIRLTVPDHLNPA